LPVRQELLAPDHSNLGSKPRPQSRLLFWSPVVKLHGPTIKKLLQSQ